MIECTNKFHFVVTIFLLLYSRYLTILKNFRSTVTLTYLSYDSNEPMSQGVSPLNQPSTMNENSIAKEI